MNRGSEKPVANAGKDAIALDVAADVPIGIKQQATATSATATTGPRPRPRGAGSTEAAPDRKGNRCERGYTENDRQGDP
jgi:hypothetical protein